MLRNTDKDAFYIGDLCVEGQSVSFQANVTFKNLGLALIDEQQWFGMKPRNRLVGQGENDDVCMREHAFTYYPNFMIVEYMRSINGLGRRSKPLSNRVESGEE
ncbi:hypothetical protein TNCV_225501 [Trichonephila clavipes]|nr:hypothetical protein TNCV_225501 [Trichonephila clavipes]